jgi:hypothetical protein
VSSQSKKINVWSGSAYKSCEARVEVKLDGTTPGLVGSDLFVDFALADDLAPADFAPADFGECGDATDFGVFGESCLQKSRL